MMPPPPVRPTSASDPHVEVTPTVQEEKKRRSPLLPAEDIADPGNMYDINPPEVVVEPPQVDTEVDAQAQPVADVTMEEPQVNAVIPPDSLSRQLPETHKPPPSERISRHPVKTKPAPSHHSTPQT